MTVLAQECVAYALLICSLMLERITVRDFLRCKVLTVWKITFKWSLIVIFKGSSDHKILK